MSLFGLIGLGFAAGILIICGYMIKEKKQYWLISGYNTYSAEKKKQVDVEKLGPLLGNFCYALGAMILLSGIFGYLEYSWLMLITLLSILPLTVVMIIKAQKYDLNALKSDGKMKTSTKWLIGFVILSCLIPLPLLYSSAKAYEITFDQANKQVEIHAFMGPTIAYDGVRSITLYERPLKNVSKIVGSDFGDIRRGNFKIDDLGLVQLFTESKEAPFIKMVTDSKIVLLNKRTKEETLSLYQELIKNIKPQ